jgi:hypothetical protein
VAAGRQARLDNLGTEFDERADHVADDLRPTEEVGQGRDIVIDLNDVMVNGLNAGNPLEHLLDQVFVPPGSGERDVVLAKVFTDEPPGVPGGPVYDNGFGAHAVDLSGGDDGVERRCQGTAQPQEMK